MESFDFVSVIARQILVNGKFSKCVGQCGTMATTRSAWCNVPPDFSAPEAEAQVHYCDRALCVVRPSVCLSSVRPSLTFHIFDHFSETA